MQQKPKKLAAQTYNYLLNEVKEVQSVQLTVKAVEIENDLVAVFINTNKSITVFNEHYCIERKNPDLVCKEHFYDAILSEVHSKNLSCEFNKKSCF